MMKRRELEIGGRTVRYYEAGDGPALVFLHGAGATGRLWKPLAARLASMFRVIAPDLPGFGGSQPQPYIRAVGDYSRFVLDFMDGLGIARAHVAGSSMGGWAACWFAVDFPDRVDRLVLVSPAGLYFEEMPPMSLRDIIAGIEAACAELGEPAAREFEPNADTLRSFMETGGFEPDLVGALSGITRPTLIIWGSADPVIPPEYAGAFMAGIAGSAVKIIEGAGHLPYIDQPEETSRTIGGFLSSKNNT